jgi:hypothetical protein
MNCTRAASILVILGLAVAVSWARDHGPAVAHQAGHAAAHAAWIAAQVLCVVFVLGFLAVVRHMVRRQRYKSGACLTCARKCQTGRAPEPIPVRDPGPVLVGLPSWPDRPAVTAKGSDDEPARARVLAGR